MVVGCILWLVLPVGVVELFRLQACYFSITMDRGFGEFVCITAYGWTGGLSGLMLRQKQKGLLPLFSKERRWGAFRLIFEVFTFSSMQRALAGCVSLSLFFFLKYINQWSDNSSFSI